MIIQTHKLVWMAFVWVRAPRLDTWTHSTHMDNSHGARLHMFPALCLAVLSSEAAQAASEHADWITQDLGQQVSLTLHVQQAALPVPPTTSTHCAA